MLHRLRICLFIVDGGNLIYSDHRPDPSWDGTSHGKDVNPGVFYYVFKGVCKNGKPLSKSGDVTLIR